MAELNNPRIAIVGGETLAGREMRELIAAITPEPVLVQVSGEAASAKIARDDGGDAIILTPMSAGSFRDVRAVVLAGTPESSRRALELTAGSGIPLIDLTGALEDQSNARLRAPVLESGGTAQPDQNLHVIAQSAAVSLALFYSRLMKRWPIARSVVQVFEPASERGQAGLHELQAQTVNLLSFKPMPKDVFDAQLGFNLLAAYGTESPERLEDCEQRIDRHLATLLLISSRAPMPSLRLVQAPVFHGYSFSLWVEFTESPEVDDLEGALASAQIEVRTSGEDPPTNVGVAGQSGAAIGNVRRDRNNPRAYWFWMVTDNARMLADTAVDVLKEYL